MAAVKRDENRVPGLAVQNTIGSSVLFPTGATLTNSTPSHVAIVDSKGNQIGQFGSEVYNQKITTSGSIVYVAYAAPGTIQGSALWQAHKIDSTDANNVVITWADNGQFTQVATDLTSLTYA